MRPSHFAIPIIALAGSAGLAACASVDPSEAEESEEAFLARIDDSRECFTEREVRGYAAAPDDRGLQERITVDTGRNEEFVLETLGPCDDLDFALRVSITSQSPGSLCSGDLAYIMISSRNAAGTSQCTARVLGRLMPEEG